MNTAQRHQFDQLPPRVRFFSTWSVQPPFDAVVPRMVILNSVVFISARFVHEQVAVQLHWRGPLFVLSVGLTNASSSAEALATYHATSWHQLALYFHCMLILIPNPRGMLISFRALRRWWVNNSPVDSVEQGIDATPCIVRHPNHVNSLSIHLARVGDALVLRLNRREVGRFMFGPASHTPRIPANMRLAIHPLLTSARAVTEVSLTPVPLRLVRH